METVIEKKRRGRKKGAPLSHAQKAAKKKLKNQREQSRRLQSNLFFELLYLTCGEDLRYNRPERVQILKRAICEIWTLRKHVDSLSKQIKEISDDQIPAKQIQWILNREKRLWELVQKQAKTSEGRTRSRAKLKRGDDLHGNCSENEEGEDSNGPDPTICVPRGSIPDNQSALYVDSNWQTLIENSNAMNGSNTLSNRGSGRRNKRGPNEPVDEMNGDLPPDIPIKIESSGLLSPKGGGPLKSDSLENPSKMVEHKSLPVKRKRGRPKGSLNKKGRKADLMRKQRQVQQAQQAQIQRERDHASSLMSSMNNRKRNFMTMMDHHNPIHTPSFHSHHHHHGHPHAHSHLPSHGPASLKRRRMHPNPLEPIHSAPSRYTLSHHHGFCGELPPLPGMTDGLPPPPSPLSMMGIDYSAAYGPPPPVSSSASSAVTASTMIPSMMAPPPSASRHTHRENLFPYTHGNAPHPSTSNGTTTNHESNGTSSSGSMTSEGKRDLNGCSDKKSMRRGMDLKIDVGCDYTHPKDDYTVTNGAGNTSNGPSSVYPHSATSTGYSHFNGGNGTNPYQSFPLSASPYVGGPFSFDSLDPSTGPSLMAQSLVPPPPPPPPPSAVTPMKSDPNKSTNHPKASEGSPHSATTSALTGRSSADSGSKGSTRTSELTTNGTDDSSLLNKSTPSRSKTRTTDHLIKSDMTHSFGGGMAGIWTDEFIHQNGPNDPVTPPNSAFFL